MRLFDVNLLIALSWPTHRHSAVAHQWFGGLDSPDFATCGITESAYLRLMRNAAIIPENPSISTTLAMLERIRSAPGWRFLGDAPSPLEPGLRGIISRTHGYRQMTDAYLIGLAAHHGMRLATLDAKLLATFGEEHIELIPTA